MEKGCQGVLEIFRGMNAKNKPENGTFSVADTAFNINVSGDIFIF